MGGSNAEIATIATIATILSSSSFTLFYLGKASKICKVFMSLSPAVRGTTTFSNPTQRLKFPNEYYLMPFGVSVE